MKECDLCGGIERAKHMALTGVTITRIGSAGHPDNPQSADVCDGCTDKPIQALYDLFWRADLAEEAASAAP